MRRAGKAARAALTLVATTREAATPLRSRRGSYGKRSQHVDAARIAHLRGGTSGFHLHVGAGIVEHVLRSIAAPRYHAPVGPFEAQRALLVPPDPKPTLVHQPVMVRAEQQGVVEARLPAVRPMHDVMSVDVTLPMAAGKCAAAIARPERAPQRRRDRAALSSDVERHAALVLRDRDQAAVAAEPLHGLDRQIGASGPSAEGRLVDVHDDLI